MKIQPIEVGFDLAQSFGSARAPGVHMSDLYNSYYQAVKPHRYKTWSGTKPTELWEAGMVLEETLEEGLTRRCVLAEGSGRPEPFQTDEGIWYSPDLIIFNGETRVGEIKLTFMSTKGIQWGPGTDPFDGFDPKFDRYITQIMCYCKHIPTRYARLYTFFVRGDYKGPEPKFWAWDLEFTQREIDEEWDLVYRHAKRAGLLKGLKP